jgi:5-methylcytosine-specific restriction endonuclease McrA
MSKEKQKVRDSFRTSVFSRDGNKCRVCSNSPGKDEQPLDAHHITSRKIMPNGGYVKENGISLCGKCHIFAEAYDVRNGEPKGFSPNELYFLINSSYDRAYQASTKLKEKE